jgi:hypothetical protein
MNIQKIPVHYNLLCVLLNRCRDVLDAVAHEVKGRVGMLKENNWNQDYHLDLTITVEDAREVFALTDELDELWRIHKINPDL